MFSCSGSALCSPTLSCQFYVWKLSPWKEQLRGWSSCLFQNGKNFMRLRFGLVSITWFDLTIELRIVNRWRNPDFLLLWCWHWIPPCSWQLQQVPSQFTQGCNLCLLCQLFHLHLLRLRHLLYPGVHGTPERCWGWRCCPVWARSCFPGLSWSGSCYCSFSFLGFPVLHHAAESRPWHAVLQRGVPDDRLGG